jgi:signal peptidase II
MTLLQPVAARRGYFITALVVIVIDQVTKVLADRMLRGRDPVPVIPEFFSLWYSRNPGGLFGYFRDWGDPWRTLTLTLVPLVAIVLIALFLARTDEPDRSTLSGLALILGGAVGNLIDRILRGEVVDFLDVYASHELLPGLAGWLSARFGTVHWPTFNVADSAIVIGVGLLMLDILRPQRSPTEADPPSPPDGR